MDKVNKVNVPVALIIFNRPEMTEKVFEVIRRVRPGQLFIIADGPRDDTPSDVALCRAARAVFDKVDWPCEQHRNFSDDNMGCGKRPVSGISWVFEHVDKAIILEDDCLPHPTFFQFCEELLYRYQDDQRIMHIAGYNRGISRNKGNYSYFFSKLPLCWGWATWRRAWCHFDFDINHFEDIRAQGLFDGLLGERHSERFWEKRFESLKQSARVDIWDFQWDFACWIQSGLAIVPNVNLVRNIGLGQDATHTKELDLRVIELHEKAIVFPLNHPPYMIRDTKLDRSIFRDIENGFFHRNLSLLIRILKKVRYLFNLNGLSKGSQ